MFQSLSEKFAVTFRNLRGHGKLSAANVQEALRDIRLNLLAADVHVKVVKEFLAKVTEKALGTAVLQSLKPAEQFVKMVYDEMVEVLGGKTSGLDLSASSPVTLMCVGLQGSGKTTTVAKLGAYWQRQKKRVLLVPLDLQRPAAVEQLITLGRDNQLDVYEDDEQNPVEKAAAAVQYAKERLYDVAIFDTAGRLHIDGALMSELQSIRNAIPVHRTVLVLDAMIGQDAIVSSAAFADTIPIDGLILTKADGDARGGSVLSVHYQLKRPIYFTGVGEKIDALEPFYPERMASQILGMGDVVSLMEEVQKELGSEEREQAQWLSHHEFSLNDFKNQLEQAKNVEKIEKLLSFLPSGGRLAPKLEDQAGLVRDIRRKIAIIQAMTREERAKPKILNGSRRKRIAKGAGLEVREVNFLLKEFESIKQMMKQAKQRGGLRNVLGGLKHVS